MTDTSIPRVYDEPTSSTRGRDVRPETIAGARARLGQLLGDKYRLDEVIGSGGMGDVYRATNTIIGRTVAIKVLRRDHVANKEVVERFSREARTTNRIRHPNVVEVTDLGQDADGCPYIVQEYLEGMTLLEYAAVAGGKLGLADLADILGPVLSAVAEAHDLSIVHRDLKPENVFLSKGRRGTRVPKVLDFGISKVRTSETEQTRAGVMMGTPAYMAPELIASWRDADVRTDVWSLGVIIFEMLTGTLPFEGNTVGAMMRAVTTENARRLCDVEPSLPRALSDVVEKCLQRDPSQRYADAQELAIDLARVLSETKGSAVSAWSLLPPGARNDKAATADARDPTLPALAPAEQALAEPRESEPRPVEPAAPANKARELSAEDTLPSDMKASDDVVLVLSTRKPPVGEPPQPAPETDRLATTAKTPRARVPRTAERTRRTKRRWLTRGDVLAIAGTLVMLALAVVLFVEFVR